MAIEPQRYRFNVDEYDKMAEAGIFDEDDRVELIDGEIVKMPPVGPRHARIVIRLEAAFAPLVVAGRALVSTQNPLRLTAEDETHPDVALLRPEAIAGELRRLTEADALLVVEVSDTSLKRDRQRKALLYARHEVPEYWLIDVKSKLATVTVYRNPGKRGYRDVQVVRPGEPLAPLAFPDLRLDTAELLG